MADVVSREEVARLRNSDGPYTRLANSHEELRTRLEIAERALRELLDGLAATRVVAAVFADSMDDPRAERGVMEYQGNFSNGQMKRFRAALGAAGERSEDG